MAYTFAAYTFAAYNTASYTFGSSVEFDVVTGCVSAYGVYSVYVTAGDVYQGGMSTGQVGCC